MSKLLRLLELIAIAGLIFIWLAGVACSIYLKDYWNVCLILSSTLVMLWGWSVRKK